MSEKQDNWIYEEHRSGLRMGYLVKQNYLKDKVTFKKFPFMTPNLMDECCSMMTWRWCLREMNSSTTI